MYKLCNSNIIGGYHAVKAVAVHAGVVLGWSPGTINIASFEFGIIFVGIGIGVYYSR